ncbi:MAG: NifU family protein [Candidatus Hodarchaeales archaeon]
MEDKIELILDEIRPVLEADGGGVEFVSFDSDSGTVSVKLLGACGGCPMRQMTLSRGIEARIKQKIPEVSTVKAV